MHPWVKEIYRESTRLRAVDDKTKIWERTPKHLGDLVQLFRQSNQLWLRGNGLSFFIVQVTVVIFRGCVPENCSVRDTQNRKHAEQTLNGAEKEQEMTWLIQNDGAGQGNCAPLAWHVL
jgi:hypothetical protein